MVSTVQIVTLWETFTVCELENGPVEIVDLPMKKVMFHLFFVCLPEGNLHVRCVKDLQMDPQHDHSCHGRLWSFLLQVPKKILGSPMDFSPTIQKKHDFALFSRFSINLDNLSTFWGIIQYLVNAAMGMDQIPDGLCPYTTLFVPPPRHPFVLKNVPMVSYEFSWKRMKYSNSFKFCQNRDLCMFFLKPYYFLGAPSTNGQKNITQLERNFAQLERKLKQ